MVKSYDRYEFEDCFGIVNSKTSNCVFLNYSSILSGHDECVSLWNIHEKEIKKKLTVPFTAPYYFFSYHVTHICVNPKNKNMIAVGYVNGCIKVFDVESNKISSTFSGHTSAINKLKFNEDGNYLCSCGKDTNVILWDVVNDQGLFKLEGHTNIVNDIEFLRKKNNYVDNFMNNNLLISASKDCLIKVWDLNIQLCVQTVVDCEEEITSILINETNTRLIVACNSAIKVYKIDMLAGGHDKFSSSSKVYLSFLASIKRPSNSRIQNMKMVFLVQSESHHDGVDVQEERLLYDDDGGDGSGDGDDNGDGDGDGYNDKDNNSWTHLEKSQAQDGEAAAHNTANDGNAKGNTQKKTNRDEDPRENPSQEKKPNSDIRQTDKYILSVIKKSLNKSVKLCNRSNYCADGDNNGILLCCTNVKKIELYKINSVKNQKKSEKNKKKRILEKLKKKKKAILKEAKRIEKFKGTQNIDFTNLMKIVKSLEEEITLHGKYHFHTANDEVKFLFHYNCKFRLQYLDVYRRRKRDSYIYLLAAYVTNRLSVFQVNLFDVLTKRDEFVVRAGDAEGRDAEGRDVEGRDAEGRDDGERGDGEDDGDEGDDDKGDGDEGDGDEDDGDENDGDEGDDSEDGGDEDDDGQDDDGQDDDGQDDDGQGDDSEDHGGESQQDHAPKGEARGRRGATDKIVEKKIYDYSKCFKETCEINKGHNSTVQFLSLSEKNELLVSICKKYVKVWSMRTFQNTITINLEGCTNALFCEEDEYLLISDDAGYIYLYELRNIELRHSHKAHANGIISMCKNVKENRFLSVGEESYLKVFELCWREGGAESSGEESDERGEGDERGERVGRDERDGREQREGAPVGKAARITNKRRRTNGSGEAQSSELQSEGETTEKKTQLTFNEADCYNLSDKVSCAIYSPNGKYICVGYLNNLIEVLYSDTLKLHLTLYGHSLPITCMDISKDNTVLASSSADKFLILWNIEYGSITKRMHTNCDVLTKINFFNKSNHLISISRDGFIKMWDAIKFQCICTMDGNFGVLTSLAINIEDNYFLTSGTHRSIRCWMKRDDDFIFLEEERDKELNLQIEKEAVRNDLSYPSSVEKNALLSKATIKTIDTIKSSEKLIEYLDIIEEELTLMDIYFKNLTEYEEAKRKNELPDFVQPPNKVKPRPELLNKNPYEFIIEVMCNIKKNILHEVLISLPFSYAYKLLNYIKTYLMAFYFFQRIQNDYGKFRICGDLSFHVEYSINVVLSIVNIYRNQFLFDVKFRFLLYELHQLIIPHLRRSLDQCAFNQSTLGFLLHALDDEEMPT
ncbi:WD domain G-beta repeat domain containing protein [Plasmodium cynomolgi strain B]|uniref:WD domain G-beta repeat domain containing protein n=1 Tax=Plasmodium cynomolgi (strain B) TaxID=1120755 RepID=K6UEC4_PLACD|nr:WD domain G-beta repeat domain containing protein [Plasmodium cynomolgi strain B]GAB68106.1 WD domain G-beta repeat domain containing protein [Plasmodium cynomolgi strain B]